MRKLPFPVAALGAAALAAAFAASASATRPASFHSAYTEEETPVSTRTAGGNTLITVTEVGALAGDIAGPVTATESFVIHADGSFVLHSLDVCTCTIGGRTGTFTYRIQGTGSLGDFVVGSGPIEGEGSGGLAGLHVQAHWSLGPDDVNGIPIDGTYHFDP